MIALLDRCPACGGEDLMDFHHVPQVPTNTCLLLSTRDEVAALPFGALVLAFCGACGFITNRAFDPTLTEYSPRYEETQAYSGRFVGWARDLAARWVDDHGLRGRTVYEIGCGKGEFLEYMVDAGVAGGVGIDPGVHPERRAVRGVQWIRDFFTGEGQEITQDAVVCRHTLEHIHPVRSFLLSVRRAIGERPDVPVLFEVPDVRRVLEEGAFWDLYYEHCTYFTAGSLARLFRSCGFVVEDVQLDYEDQYILLAARVAEPGEPTGAPLPIEDDLDSTRRAAETLQKRLLQRLAETRAAVDEVAAGGGRTVLWGAGSKGVSYLGALGDSSTIDYAVDINPYKHGRFVAGSGQRIVPPDFLREWPPSLVIAMNPVYVDEIRRLLDDMGLQPRLVAV